MRRTIRQALVSILLIIVAVPALATMSAKGLSPSTGIKDSTTTSTVTVSTSYATSTVARNDTIYASERVFVKAVNGWEEELYLRANKGDTVYVKLTSNIAITFAVLADTNHSKWVQAGYPSPPSGFFSSALLLKAQVLSWSGKFVIPSDGGYWFMFFNYSNQTAATVHVDATISYAATTWLASTILSTVLQSNPTPTGAVSINLILQAIAVGGILALLASAIFLAKRKRELKKSAAKSATPPTGTATASKTVPPKSATAMGMVDEMKKPKAKKRRPPPKETPSSGPRICVNCNAQLPPDAVFCGECGHVVEAQG
ncbi:MAG: zinc ribbon domain-containing protein [Candidatus Bathyarchaeia archaeon]